MPESFGLRLRKWRGKRMQKEIAFILDVPLGTIRKWEYGKRTPTKISQVGIAKLMKENP